MKEYAIISFRGIKLKARSRLTKNLRFPTYSAAFLGTYLTVLFFRPYQLASQIGWLDPWTAIGFGDVFPKTPYTWHYYKESRFFSILYQSLLMVYFYLVQDLYALFQQ